MEIEKIDSALLRKGRIIAKYEFNPLEISKTQNLFKKLNIDIIATKPLTLAEIYNYNEKNYENTRKAVGFKNVEEVN